METPQTREAPEEEPVIPQPLLQQVQALRSLMPRAETLLGQVADYIRAAEDLAAVVDAGRNELEQGRNALAAERAEFTSQRDRLLQARADFDASAERQEAELEALRSQLAETCGALTRTARESQSTAEQLRSELETARARVAELERLSHASQPDTGTALAPAARRLELMEAELARARSERGRMLAILGLTRSEAEGAKAAA